MISRGVDRHAKSDSRSLTGVEWALDNTNETLRSMSCQYIPLLVSSMLTVLLKSLNYVAQLLSRCEYAITCSSISRHLHLEWRYLRLRAPEDPGRWPG